MLSMTSMRASSEKLGTVRCDEPYPRSGAVASVNLVKIDSNAQRPAD